MKTFGHFFPVNVAGYCELKPNAGKESHWVWCAFDCSGGEPKTERLALSFYSFVLALTFGKAFEGAKCLRWPVPTLSG